MAAPENNMDKMYQRAISDPTSLSRAEKNFVRGWPAPEEEDRLCVEHTGLDRAGLVAKALADVEDLNLVESSILGHLKGVNFDAYKGLTIDQHLERMRRPKNPLMFKAWEALDAADHDTDDRRAVRAAKPRLYKLQRARSEEIERHWIEHELQNTPWLTDMLKNGLLRDADCWGFVVFRTSYSDESSWERFQDYFAKAGEVQIRHNNSGPLLWPHFRATFVSHRDVLSGASTQELRSKFRQMLDAGEIPAGMRTNCFLVVDDAAITSDVIATPYKIHLGPPPPTVFDRAVDPDYEEENQEAQDGGSSDGMAGFQGEVTLALPKAFDWLHVTVFNAERQIEYWGDIQGRSGWEHIYHQTKTPENWTPVYSPVSGSVAYYDPPVRIPSWMQPPPDLFK